MTPDFNISLGFLRLIYPDGPWMLTAISVDKKSIEARTFESSETEDVIAWLTLHKAKNLYYSVNQPTQNAREKRKLSKTDIHSVHFLHVDVDPRAGEDVDAEQARILAQLTTYKIPPSVIVFSGGGYNALWRLDAPFDVANKAASDEEAIARAVDLERRNWQLELDFNTPDHCRDVSRILRLPGTINRPNAEKIAKGRVPALSRIHNETTLTYNLSTFMATPHVATNVSKNTKTPSAGATNVQRVESLDQLKQIPDKLKVIIAQGFDPEEPNRWNNDRSSALYFVCCELVRCGLPNEVILGIILDSRFIISASVLDKGTRVMQYAHRQVEKARDNADHPMLAKMNEEFAVILGYGSNTVVMVEHGFLNPHTKQYEPIFQSFRSFKERIKSFPNIEIEFNGKKKYISAFEWWTSHPRRRQFSSVTFEPGADTPDQFNMWTGFACLPQPGDKHERFLEHVFENICNANQEHYDYLIRWMARVVQHPRTQSMVAIVLLGERGTGKSIFCDFFGAIFEPHRYVASDINELTGKFNAHLGQCVFVAAEEAFDIRDKRHESVLKERITGRTTGIERKGVDRIQMPNYAHLVMTSNNERVVPAGDFERRFFVLRVSNKRIQNSTYFKAILADQREGGLQNLLHHLMSIDLTNYDVTMVPQTEELRAQQEHNLSFESDWLLSKLEAGQWLPGLKWEGPVRKKLLHEDYRAYLAGMNVRFIKGERGFHQFIMKEIPGATSRQVYGKDAHDRPMVFMFPPLEECRKAFDKARGWHTNWPKVSDDVNENTRSNIIHLPGKAFE